MRILHPFFGNRRSSRFIGDISNAPVIVYLRSVVSSNNVSGLLKVTIGGAMNCNSWIKIKSGSVISSVEGYTSAWLSFINGRVGEYLKINIDIFFPQCRIDLHNICIIYIELWWKLEIIEGILSSKFEEDSTMASSSYIEDCEGSLRFSSDSGSSTERYVSEESHMNLFLESSLA